MSSVRFKSGDVDLELSGSEAFVVRQLTKLAPFLAGVDPGALEGFRSVAASSDGSGIPASGPAPAEESAGAGDGNEAPDVESNGRSAATAPEASVERAGLERVAPESEQDGLRAFLEQHPPAGRDRQTDAALLIAYYLQTREARRALRMGDLVGSCIRAGIDTRNLNRPIGILTRRGLLEEAPGNTYRISSQGVQTVESRL